MSFLHPARDLETNDARNGARRGRRVLQRRQTPERVSGGDRGHGFSARLRDDDAAGAQDVADRRGADRLRGDQPFARRSLRRVAVPVSRIPV